MMFCPFITNFYTGYAQLREAQHPHRPFTETG